MAYIPRFGDGMGKRARVLVTGSTGFIGRHVIAVLQRDGSVAVPAPRFPFRAENLIRAMGPGVDCCIHLAWYADPADYQTNATANLRSFEASMELVDALAAVGCPRIVVSGTCAEYAPSARPISESQPLEPLTVYAAEKAALHSMLLTDIVASRLQVAWARLFNVTGPGEHRERLVPAVVRELGAGRRVPLTAGDQIRDFLDVADVAEALCILAHSSETGAWNVCSGEGIAVASLLKLLAERLGRSDLLGFGERQLPPDETPILVGDSQRLVKTGWQRRIGLEALIERAITAHLPGPVG